MRSSLVAAHSSNQMIANEQGGTRPGHLPVQLLLLSWGPQDTVLFAVSLVVFHSAREYLHRVTTGQKPNQSRAAHDLSNNPYKSSAQYLKMKQT